MFAKNLNKLRSKMEEHNITQLLVMDEKKYLGIVHLHDILNEGII